MSVIFISHSSRDNFEAVAIRDWLMAEGWNEIFLDIDPDRGIAAGERWERALHEAANRCEAVVFLVSAHWLASGWCMREYTLARSLNKKLFAIVIDAGHRMSELPPELSGTWQVVDLSGGQDMRVRRVALPGSHEERHVAFSEEGLRRLRRGLTKAGLDPKYFAWPPENDRERAPYRGLRSLDTVDAGIFFGREAEIVEGVDKLRGMCAGAGPRVLVILGASGAGKSSFLRAGLLPRLMRDESLFLTAPPIRPERAALTGEGGLVGALEAAFSDRGVSLPRADIRSAVFGGVEAVRPLLKQLVERAFAQSRPGESRRPTIVLAVDQAEELFSGDRQDEAEALLRLVRGLTLEDDPAVVVLLTIRSDSYDALQTAPALEGVRQQTLPLSPLPRGAYQIVVEGPVARLNETSRRLALEPRLTQRLLEDIGRCEGVDALPLLAFTLEQLYLDYGRAGGALRLEHYESFGGLNGAIKAAVERAFARADADPRIPRERKAREAVLRRGFIPWLAGVDPDTRTPRRNIADRSEIPPEARPLIDLLVEERLLTTDATKDGDPGNGAVRRRVTIEPAHEALLRQWPLLQGWLVEDLALLITLEGIKRASHDWQANLRANAWLAHQGERLAETHALEARSDIAARLDASDRDYVAACRAAQMAARRRSRRVQALINLLLVGIIVGLIGWMNEALIGRQLNWLLAVEPYALAHVQPHVLSAANERALKPLATFRECDRNCPVMVVIPAGAFVMGSPSSEPGHVSNEAPQHAVTIPRSFAVSQTDVTFDDWGACVAVHVCPTVSDGNYGQGTRPTINVSWNDAQTYVAWLSTVTGKPYRLLSEAEWEYAARAGATTAYYWGPSIGVGNAVCGGCGSSWDRKSTAPVGSFKPNAFGLFDMAGNVRQLVEDCWHDSYSGAPIDGSAWKSGQCGQIVLRGGSWDTSPAQLRSAARVFQPPDYRDYYLGFRVARTLSQ